MSNWSEKIPLYHQIIDKALFKALSLLLGFYNTAMVMWDPNSYADRVGGFNAVIAPLMIWAICASMIFGIGFKPRYWLWQIIFSPYISMTILSYLTVIQFIN
ncbi:cyd operon protein YbgE [Vibrio metoecus]|uniref:Cytochrome bd biosynthesis protein n=1 Tax=Vibrio metoecus TaxID=1481663 RepID=A0A067B946_VIBMT|nr:cyd operon protein YbgE [Vibrio metoecus]KDO14628.1 cytochrome bd biosynthesis protein [Vibrio metoecus]KQA23310.1 cytochrome bd biosynthesis protein [Vibrio metoecus]KQB02835.1 cytochrome bd biosynthesis protein [Vibrio metoecus]KQB04123.1 cytochrome bd biosynthesis protein [Vibrio metoecus]PAR30049.1 cyd operon protein YbgE [Vibrio metoecus]